MKAKYAAEGKCIYAERKTENSSLKKELKKIGGEGKIKISLGREIFTPAPRPGRHPRLVASIRVNGTE